MKKFAVLIIYIILGITFTPKIASQTFVKYGMEIQFTEPQEGEVRISITNQNPYTVYCQLLINKQVYWVLPIDSELTYILEFNNNIEIKRVDTLFWKCWGAGFYQFKYLGNFTYNIH